MFNTCAFYAAAIDTSKLSDDISESVRRISERVILVKESIRHAMMRPNKQAVLPAENESLAELAYRVIRERILSGEYSLGTALPRRELAANLGMSIVPVNDALARLEHEYLI